MDRKRQIERELKRTRGYLPFIKRCLLRESLHLVKFREATPEEDMKEGFDFVLQADASEIAIRIRRPDCQYRDFTIRAKVPSGHDTEIHKIKDGKGDIYFYAWTELINGQERITQYWIIDLDKFRCGNSIKKEDYVSNGDDGTGFYKYRLSDLVRDGAIMVSRDLKKLYAA